MAEPKNKPVVNLASAAEGAEVKVTDDGTLPDRLRNMVRNPNAIGTHSAACWQWHDDCALLLAADRVAERDAERAARERAEAEARQLREAIETAESVGVDYCTLHHGIRNEDEHSCDFRDDDQESGDDGEPRECVLVELIPRPPLAVVAEGAEDRGQTHTQGGGSDG